MKKILSVMFIVSALVAHAMADDLSDARRRERDALLGHLGLRHLIPQPSRPPMPPPPPPGYNDIYGPGRTVRWQDMGVIHAIKFIAFDVDLSVHGQFVNEIYLVAQDNHVGIKSAQARLTNGQTIELRHLTGTIRQDQQLRLRMDYNYSLRIESIMLTVESPNLFGSSGTLGIQLGLAH